MLIIPAEQVAPDTLAALIEEFVTRDGTDYGDVECSTASKVEQVLGQLRRGEVCLCFDEVRESCNILPAAQAKSLVNE